MQTPLPSIDTRIIAAALKKVDPEVGYDPGISPNMKPDLKIVASGVRCEGGPTDGVTATFADGSSHKIPCMPIERYRHLIGEPLAGSVQPEVHLARSKKKGNKERSREREGTETQRETGRRVRRNRRDVATKKHNTLTVLIGRNH